MLIVLRRDIVKQCLSYIVLNNFSNISIAWQWYLHPMYRKKIINPDPFLLLVGVCLPLWFCYEMLARQEYYVQKFSKMITMQNVTFEELTTNTGAQDFHNILGQTGKCVIPSPNNENKVKPSKILVQLFFDIVGKINVDIPQLFEGAIKKGFSFEET